MYSPLQQASQHFFVTIHISHEPVNCHCTVHTHIIIKAQDKTCDFGACVAMTSPRVKRCKVEPGHADDGDDDDDLHENKCQPLAALTEDAELNAVVKDCQAQWGVWCQTGHPLEHLRQSLQETEYRTEVLRTLFQHMKIVHPDMPKTLLSRINLSDAVDESIGCSGEGHLFMIGYNVVKGLDWPVMWKGDPALFRLHSVWMRALTSGRGLDTTARNLKLCVSQQMCDLPEGNIANQLLFAGYTSGSTLGSGCLLLAFMLLNCKASPWQLDKVKAFMKSIARVKVTFVVHKSAASRSADAWRTLGINLNH